MNPRFFVLATAIVLMLGACASNQAPAPAEAAQPRLERRKLPNGLTVLIEEDHRSTEVNVVLLFKVGTRANEGAFWPRVVEATVSKVLAMPDNPLRRAAPVWEVVSSLGLDHTAFVFSTLASEPWPSMPRAVPALLNTLYTNPMTKDGLETLIDGLGLQPSPQLSEIVFPVSEDGCFNGRGDCSALAFQSFVRSNYGPNQAILVVAGDVKPQRAFAEIADAFQDWVPSQNAVGSPRKFTQEGAYRGPSSGTDRLELLWFAPRYTARRGLIFDLLSTLLVSDEAIQAMGMDPAKVSVRAESARPLFRLQFQGDISSQEIMRKGLATYLANLHHRKGQLNAAKASLQINIYQRIFSIDGRDSRAAFLALLEAVNDDVLDPSLRAALVDQISVNEVRAVAEDSLVSKTPFVIYPKMERAR